MLEVKISGGADEIAALFQRLGGSMHGPSIATLVGTGALVASAAVIDPLDNPENGGEFPKAPPGPEVFGSASAAPAPEASNVPGPEVFGNAAAPAPGPAPTPPGPAPVPTGAVATELDKNGLPWDGRIHASTKKKNADNSWMAKRNLDPAVKVAVEAELRQLLSFPAPPGPGPAPVPNAPPPPPASTLTPDTPGTPTPGAAAEITFASLFTRSTAAIGAGKFTSDQLATMLTRVAGTAVMPMLINRPDVWGAVDVNLTAMGA